MVDIRMPEMTGFEVTRGLKAALRDVDVILMTGNAEEPDDNLIQAIDEGAFYFIQKPFDRRVLLALVNRCLELRRLREERREVPQARGARARRGPPFPASACFLRPTSNCAGLSIDARYLACTELAGDIYDYVEASDGAVALLIADVVGHGTSAAMMTAHRQGGISSVSRRRLRAAGRGRANQRGRFATSTRADSSPCVAPGSNPRRRELIVRQRGPSPADRPHELSESPLARIHRPLLTSALSDLPCEQATVEFGPGDSILFYTDGVTEASGASGMFGTDRLVVHDDVRGSPGCGASRRHSPGSRGLHRVFDPSG